MPETRLHQPDPEQTLVLAHDERVPEHRHDRGHIVYPATGVLSLVTADGSRLAPPNRAVWIPAGFTHRHRAHGRTDMRIVFMSEEHAALLPARPAVLAMTPLAREAALALTGERLRPPDALDRLRRVLVDDLHEAPEEPLHLPQPHDPRLVEVARLVEHDLSSPATLADLGRRVGAAERTLSRLFHRETGMGFRQWRTQLRVHHAALLLTDGVSVVDTSIACGWSNPSVFIEAFGALMGQTPGRYQRSLPR